MFKNVASQSVALFAFDTTTGLPKTGDSANQVYYVTKDWGSVTAIAAASGVPTEMDATNAKGWYKIALSQAETNADALLFTGKSSTANISVTGALIFSTPPLFSSLSVNSSGLVSVTSGVKKNQALSTFMFTMTDSTTHAPKTGLTVTATRSLDGGTFASCTNAVTELTAPSAIGDYAINLSAGDLNGNAVMLRFTATGADDLNILIVTQP